jgi:hypothetical protein
MDFEILGEVTDLETIASGRGIRDLSSLLKFAAISWNSSHRRLSNGRREE